jgi:hypothetical protein
MTDAKNPYQAPQAELDAAATDLPVNLADAINGRYRFTVGEVMDEAWRLVKGMKGPFWGAAIVLGLMYGAFELIGGLALTMVYPGEPNFVVKQLYQGILGALATPLIMGLQMMCVRRALGAAVSFSTAFDYFPRAGTAIVAALLVFLLTAAGLALLIIPGIYLAVAYELTTALVCDQKLSAWQAMETSRRAITHQWWSVFGLGLLVALLTGLSALGLLIPLIWTVPWAMLTTGVLYRRIFYASQPTVAEGPPAAAPAPAAPV